MICPSLEAFAAMLVCIRARMDIGQCECPRAASASGAQRISRREQSAIDHLAVARKATLHEDDIYATHSSSASTACPNKVTLLYELCEHRIIVLLGRDSVQI